MLNMPSRILKRHILIYYSVYLSIMKRITTTIFVIFLSVLGVFSQAIIPAKDASKHLGKTVTITEKVFNSKVEKPSGTILLNMGGYEPKQDVVIMIPATDKSKFKGRPENDYKGKDITVTGKLVN